MKFCQLSGISPLVFLLVIVFNISSWIDLSAIFAELPLLVNRLPESWELPSYLLTAIHASKVSIVIFLILKHFYKERIPEVPAIYTIIVCGTSAMFSLGFLWQHTVTIGNDEYSIPILTITVILGATDSVSGVVFLPYMAHFKTEYMSAFYLGAGLNKLIPSLLSMCQGLGESPDCINKTTIVFNKTTMFNVTKSLVIPIYPEPNFSVRVFFLTVSAVMALSGVSFTLLHYLPYCQRAHVEGIPAIKNQLSPEEEPLETEASAIQLEEKASDKNLSEIKTDPCEIKYKETATAWDYVFICAVSGWMQALQYGLSSAVLPFAALPYGNRAYSLAERLAKCAFPLGAFLTVIYSPRSYVVASILTLLATTCNVYLLVLACLSPYPPMLTSAVGEVLVVRRIDHCCSPLVLSLRLCVCLFIYPCMHTCIYIA